MRVQFAKGKLRNTDCAHRSASYSPLRTRSPNTVSHGGNITICYLPVQQSSRALMRPLSTLRRSFLSHISKPVWYFAKRRVLLSDHCLPRILIMLTSACNE